MNGDINAVSALKFLDGLIWQMDDVLNDPCFDREWDIIIFE